MNCIDRSHRYVGNVTNASLLALIQIAQKGAIKSTKLTRVKTDIRIFTLVAVKWEVRKGVEFAAQLNGCGGY